MIARTARQFPLVIALVVVLAIAPIALAGKPGGGAGGHKPPSGGGGYTGTVTGPVMVADNNGNGAANAGDKITFNVTSTAPYPFVRLDCSQNGANVLSQTQGFYSGWLWGTTFNLGGQVWTSGAASCTATLYSVSYSGANEPTEAVLTFQVGA